MWTIIEVEGQRRRVAVVRTHEGAWVGWPGGSAFVRDETSESSGYAGHIDTNRVIAPMTGRVVEVVAAAGQQVEEGQLLVIIEAMKMEHRLVAPRTGVVASIAAIVGEQVDFGVAVVVLETA